jgi:hypothetical protein
MEANMHNMEERLWNYIDGTADAAEKSAVERFLQENAEWKAKYHELLEVNSLLQASELEEPSLRFTKNVMEEISRIHIAPATKNYINNNIVRAIAIFFITLIVGFIIYGFGQMDWSSSDGKMPVDLSKIDYGRIFNNTWVNVFMMFNIVAGLFFLDRFIANKRKKYREGME